jgi:sulfate permease, SulP family
VAGLIHAVTLVAVLLILTPLAASIPLASLAAILFVVAWNMSDMGRFAAIMRTAPIADRWILLITFLLTVFVDLIVAVNVGVILAVLQFLRRMAETVETQPTGAHDLKTELAELGMTHLPPDVQVYEIIGPMFFGAIENIKRPLLEIRPYPRTLIIRLDRVPFMDITGIQTLGETMHQLRKKGVSVVLCEANQRVREKLLKAGLLEGSSADECASTLAQAIARVVNPPTGAPAGPGPRTMRSVR